MCLSHASVFVYRRILSLVMGWFFMIRETMDWND